MNREAMDALVAEHVLARLDHRNLNLDIPELAGSVTTTENLAKLIEGALTNGLDAPCPLGSGPDF